MIGPGPHFFYEILKLLVYFPHVLPHNYELHISGYVIGTPQEITPVDKLRSHGMIRSYMQKVEDRQFLLRLMTPNPGWRKDLDYFQLNTIAFNKPKHCTKIEDRLLNASNCNAFLP